MCKLEVDFTRTSLVVQWIRIRLSVQGAWVWPLVQEDSTCQGATKPTGHNNRASALQPVLRNKRSHHGKKPTHRKEGWLPPAATRESLWAATQTQLSQKLPNK